MITIPKPLYLLVVVLAGKTSFAQKYPRVFEKMGLQDFQEKVNYIPTKTLTILQHYGRDSLSSYHPRSITVPGFYMCKTEVTNREYRQFVQYARDSIAHVLLGHYSTGKYTLDWSKAINWDDKRLDLMMTPAAERSGNRKEINPAVILYGLDQPGIKETINIYPDTLVWLRDFSYSSTEPLARKYFCDPNYDDYPVVGINQKQALAFCQWKTAQLRNVLKPGEEAKIRILLPSNAQWESAAFETRDTTHPKMKGKRYLYNFGNILDGDRITVKSYNDDGFFYTGPVKSYPAGDYDLFDMKGNVSEWTVTPLEEVIPAEVKATKKQTIFVVKGGGWNSPPFYLQAGVCQFFAGLDAHSYIGFRYVVEISRNP